MMQIETVMKTVAYRGHCEDRVQAFASEDRTVIVVADGAGGTGAGEIAAQTIIDDVESSFRDVGNADEWREFLFQVDNRITDGESTAVVIDIRPYGIAGASVGDSQAWILDGEQIIDLTGDQKRKPLLGSKVAEPVSFSHEPLSGVLLCGTDGFFDYAKRDKVLPLVARNDFYVLPTRCIEMVRLPSGDLWDDIGIVAARVKPQERSRKRYSI